MKKIKAYVVNHGHMDIEWYQPLTTYSEWFEESIRMLEAVCQKEKDYHCYTFDGVVFPILYLLEQKPEMKELLAKLIAEGKLKLGPFYTQFDEFLPCGESIVKNCLWGDRECRKLGAAPMKAGYLLDNFGHPAQLAQILNNFQIYSLFFSRGMCDVGDNVKEFLFCAPDQSTVVAQNFSYGISFKIYENNNPRPNPPGYLPFYHDAYSGYGYLKDLSKHVDHEGIARQLIQGVKTNARYYPSGIVPLFVGTDHCPPQEGLSQTLALANQMQDEIEFIFSDAQELSEALMPKSALLACHRGDLLGAKFDRLLFGAMTTRAYLKRQMYDGEHLLFDYALPLAALRHQADGEGYDRELEEATRLLLLNSTHDSVHGSSLDSVHRENEARFDRAAQLCARVIHGSLRSLGQGLASKAGWEEMAVYSPRDFDGYVAAWLIPEDKELQIVDGRGQSCECIAAPPEPMLYNAKGEPYYLSPQGGSREVFFRARLSAGEVKKFYYRRLDTVPPTPHRQDLIENEYFLLSVKEGAPVLTDKTTGQTLPGFLRFTEEAETGDSFDHSSPWQEAPSYCSDEFGFSQTCAEDHRLYQELNTTCTMRVNLETVGDQRSESLVDLPLRLRFRLWKGIRRVDLQIKLRNYARNHRLRAEFSFPKAFGFVRAGETFCCEDFGLTRPPMTEGWKEEHTKELPLRDWFSVSDGEQSYAVAAKGIYTFEPLDAHTVALTLFRSVGELMRINIKSRSSCCMSGIPIEDAQCLREMTFDLSLTTHWPDAEPYEIQERLDPFLYPPAVHPLRDALGGADGACSLAPFRFLDNRCLVPSLYERSYDGDFYLLRFYELNGRPTTARIHLPYARKVYRSDMNQSLLEELPLENGIVELEVGANKIITLLMK